MFALKLSLALVCLISTVSTDSISYTECDADTNIAKLNSINIPGDPIVVSASNPVNLSLSGTLSQLIDDTNAQLSLKLEKKVSVFGITEWVTVPCVDGYGSCDKNLVELWQTYNSSFVCPLFTQMGKSCDMPLQPGDYSVQDYIIPVNLSKIPSLILSLASGTIKIHIELSSNGQTLYCVDVTVDLDLESSYNEHKRAIESTKKDN